MGTIVYKYGCLAPREGLDRVLSEMRDAHRYHNDLIAIERGRRAALREHCEAPVSILAEAQRLDAEVQRVSGEIKNARKSTRSRSETQALRDELARLRVQKRDAVNAVRSARQRDPEIADAINAKAKELGKAAYALYPALGSGTRCVVDEAMGLTMKMPLFDGLEPNNPRFKRWNGEGIIGVQVNQKGEAGTGFIGSEIASNGWAELAVTHSAKRADFGFWRMRIGKNDHQTLVEWPVKIHRPIPPGAVVRRATVSLRREGPREVWSVSITLQLPDQVEDRRPAVAGLDVGWRQMGEEIRVAVWSGDDGSTGEIRIPNAVLGGLAKAAEIRAVRDKALDAMRTALTDRVPACAHWKSPERFAALSRQHPEWEDLRAWAYHDRHLWSWESGQRRKSLNRRKDLYRCAAKALGAQYGTIVLERFDLRDVARKEASDVEKARSNRHASAVSELRQALDQAAHVVTVDGADTTRTCRQCGLVSERDAMSDVIITCECGASWDQDYTAAMTIRERWSGVEVQAPDKEGKRERIARLRAEKQERETTARNEADKAAE